MSTLLLYSYRSNRRYIWFCVLVLVTPRFFVWIYPLWTLLKYLEKSAGCLVFVLYCYHHMFGLL